MLFHGIEVHARPDFLRSSSTTMILNDRRPVLLVWSLHVANLLLHGVCWHDEPEHCRTWSEGCRCDLGEES